MATNYAAYLIHYLDDFLLAGLPGQPTCSESTETMLRVCERLGIPVALDKLEGPVTNITIMQQTDLIIINNNFGKLGVLFRCWWNRFFSSWNERYMFQSSSIPTGRMQRPSTYLQMLLGTLGCGAYFNGAWFRSDYDFCSTHHRKPLPGTARTLALFVTDWVWTSSRGLSWDFDLKAGSQFKVLFGRNSV